MKWILRPGRSKNLIVTIAIGAPHFNAWESHALPGWIKYCRHNNLGLLVFERDLISYKDKKWKKATWQKMLIGETLVNASVNVNNICYLDSDILINPTAPNIFDTFDPTTIGLTSIRKNMPYPLDEVLRRLAFLRHTCYDSRYPLDSALFMSLEQLYGFHGLNPQGDEACMGLILFNLCNHSSLMRGWFDKYDRDVQSVTNGGDQTHLNYEMQTWGKVSWINYRFQAIWPFEMAWKYPFLYDYGSTDLQLIRKCVEASLYQNYFLHFAGSWPESEMWKVGQILSSTTESKKLMDYYSYAQRSVTGTAVGSVKPKALE